MRFRRVPDQKADEVPSVAGQIGDQVLEGSGTHSKQSSGGFRYKSIPRSSKLLGITHGFISLQAHTPFKLELVDLPEESGTVSDQHDMKHHKVRYSPTWTLPDLL